jgi:hypothetical protein
VKKRFMLLIEAHRSGVNGKRFLPMSKRVFMEIFAVSGGDWTAETFMHKNMRIPAALF